MDKIDNILNRLQGQQPTVPDPEELTERIMESLPERQDEAPAEVKGPRSTRPARRVRLYIASALAIAASIALLFILHIGKEQAETAPLVVQQAKEQPLMAQQGNTQPLPSHQGEIAAEHQSPQQGAAVQDMPQQKAATHNQVVAQVAGNQATAPDKSNTPLGKREKADTLTSKQAETKVYACVEQSASFPGGNRACMEFIERNLKMPELAKAYKVQARVITTFLVDSLGYLSDFKVQKTNLSCDPTLIGELPEEEQQQLREQISQQLAAEAIRIVGLMPRWSPAKINGKAINQKYVIPIRFNATTNQDNK